MIESCTCGGNAVVLTIGKFYYVGCVECGNCERGAHKTPEEAIQVWNKLVVEK